MISSASSDFYAVDPENMYAGVLRVPQGSGGGSSSINLKDRLARATHFIPADNTLHMSIEVFTEDAANARYGVGRVIPRSLG